MPRIRIYPQDLELTGGEQLFGSDPDGRTVNIPLSALAGFLNTGTLDLGVILTSPADNELSVQFTEGGVPLGAPQIIQLDIDEVNSVEVDKVGRVTTIQFQFIDSNGDTVNVGDSFEIEDGEPGADGTPAGFGSVTATTGPIGVTTSGNNDALDIAFTIPAGEQGEQGSFYVKLFRRSATALTTAPTDVIWQQPNTLSGANVEGWSLSVPAGTEQTYEVQALFNPATQTQITTWSVPFHAGGEGPTGPPGTAAGFGTPEITAVGPTDPATVTATGPDTAKIFTFEIPSGQQGIPGTPGMAGTPGADGDPGETGQSLEVDGYTTDTLGTTVTLRTATTHTPAGTFFVREGEKGDDGTPGNTVTVTETSGVVTITSSGGTSESLNEVVAGGTTGDETPEINSITIGGVVYSLIENPHGGGVTDDSFFGVASALPTTGLQNSANLDVVGIQSSDGSSNDEVFYFEYDLDDDSPLDRYAVINLPNTLTAGHGVEFLWSNHQVGPFLYQVENVFSSSTGSTSGYTTYAFGFGADVYAQVHLT